MRGGRLKHLITIQEKTETGRDSHRQPVIGWAVRGTAYAGMTARRGAEQFQDGQRYTEDVVRFEFRYEDVDGLETVHRLVTEDGRIFNIKNIMPDYDMKQNTLVDAALLDISNAG